MTRAAVLSRHPFVALSPCGRCHALAATTQGEDWAARDRFTKPSGQGTRTEERTCSAPNRRYLTPATRWVRWRWTCYAAAWCATQRSRASCLSRSSCPPACPARSAVPRSGSSPKCLPTRVRPAYACAAPSQGARAQSSQTSKYPGSRCETLRAQGNSRESPSSGRGRAHATLSSLRVLTCAVRDS
jgi:hypothetical protein